MWKRICRLKQQVAVLANMRAESILHYRPKKLWVFLLLLLSIIDYYFLRMYLPSFATLDDQMKVFPSLITFNSIIIAGIGIMYQVQETKNREMEFRIHEQRTEFYEEFLKYFADLVTPSGNNSKFIDRKAWMRLHYKMAVYASPEIIKIYSSIKENPSQNLENLAKLFLQIRNEVGFTEKDVHVRKLLGLFLNDVQDPKFDEILENIK